MPSLWSRRAERKCSFVISELFSCEARSCAACNASCIFCVYLSMRMLQNNKGDQLGNCAGARKSNERVWRSMNRLMHLAMAFDTHASTTMSDCDERAGKIRWIKVAGAFASRTVSAVHHRLAYFRQWYVDANDGA